MKRRKKAMNDPLKNISSFGEAATDILKKYISSFKKNSELKGGVDKRGLNSVKQKRADKIGEWPDMSRKDYGIT